MLCGHLEDTWPKEELVEPTSLPAHLMGSPRHVEETEKLLE